MDPEEDEEREDLPTEEVSQEEAPSSDEIGFRYSCPACTGVAYYSAGRAEQHQGICGNCANPTGEFARENLIPLTEDEKESLRQL